MKIAMIPKLPARNLRLLRKLEQEEFFLHALAYMADHPSRPWSCHVCKDRAHAFAGHAIVRGQDPVASGGKGDILAFAKEDQTGKIVQIALRRVDGKTIKADTWYGIDFQKRKVTDCG